MNVGPVPKWRTFAPPWESGGMVGCGPISMRPFMGWTTGTRLTAHADWASGRIVLRPVPRHAFKDRGYKLWVPPTNPGRVMLQCSPAGFPTFEAMPVEWRREGDGLALILDKARIPAPAVEARKVEGKADEFMRLAPLHYMRPELAAALGKLRAAMDHVEAVAAGLH